MSRLLPLALLLALACGQDPAGPTNEPDPLPVLTRYAQLAHDGYAASLAAVVTLRARIDAFLAAPSDDTLEAARDAWLAAREPYGQTEVFRFYGGPIDDDDGPEGQINAWPLDETYIDAIIADPDKHPTLTPETLAALNEQGGEKNIATGYHAIEYLLWGADTHADSPGRRPASDYAKDNPRAERRAAYLRAVAELLERDLRAMVAAWKPGAPDNYRAAFLAAKPADSLAKILTGMGSLSGAELAGERMTVAYDTREQEDEHSCFSDNTHRDIVTNAMGIRNVYTGNFGKDDGPGIDDLVMARDAALHAELMAQLDASVAACEAIQAPFDRAIADEAGRKQVKAAITALQAQTRTIARVARTLGITLDFD